MPGNRLNSQLNTGEASPIIESTSWYDRRSMDGREAALVVAQDRQNNGPDMKREQPVRLDAWVAASQPQLGPARRKVLLSVAELTQDGDWVASSQVKELSGGQRQPVNRHLRALESDGLVSLQFRGRGMPLYVKATSAGLRAVGLRGPLRAPEPVVMEPAPGPAPVETAPAPAPAPSGRMERFASSLYQALQPYLAGLEYQEFRRLLIVNLAAALGRRQAPAPAPAPAAIEAPAEPAAQPVSARQIINQAVRTTVSQALHPEPAAPAPAPVEPEVLEAEPPAPAPAPAMAAASQPAQPAAAPEVLAPESRPGGPVRLPLLNPAEQALEDRLALSANPAHRDLPWWQRTKEFSDQWDRMRRWRLGTLGTCFTSFAPRWEHVDWPLFNRGRRQADARGARYMDWIEAQFDRLNNKVPAKELQGDEAVNAWQKRMAKAEARTASSGELGPPPYTPETFNVFNPDHAGYAEELLGQIMSLAQRVYGDDPDGPVRLLGQAVLNGNLPLTALDLRPQWKGQVLAALGAHATPVAPTATSAQTAAAAAVMAATRPAVII